MSVLLFLFLSLLTLLLLLLLLVAIFVLIVVVVIIAVVFVRVVVAAVAVVIVVVAGLWKGVDSLHHTTWDSHLEELGAPKTEGIGMRGRGLGVPRVDSLYPSICPIGIYDCKEERCVDMVDRTSISSCSLSFQKPSK